MDPYGEWEPIIGLEIHVQLNTKTKLFSPAPNRFGDEPNTNITEICTGQPGALPVLNKEAVKKAVLFGLAINASVQKWSKFDRKSYFYPDSPRNFQITQFDKPIIIGGSIITTVEGEEKHFAINRAHLEDDAGMLKHFSSFAGVDYNRAGVPLLEIVSEPCIHSPKQASSYAMAIKAIMEYIDASDCNMAEGSLRFDANISVRKKTETSFRTKTEIKNMNSFAFMEMAVEAEIQRQIALYTENPEAKITSCTYRWDAEKKENILMRKKEAAEDYHYFPEPDLTPIVLSQEYIDTLQKDLPELPLAREKRYLSEFELSAEFASILCFDKTLSDYFEKAIAVCPYPKMVCNWIVVEFFGKLKETGKTLPSLGIPPEHLGKLVLMIEKKIITSRMAKQIADDMIAHPGKDPEKIVEENPDYKPMDDTSSIEPIVDQVLKENPQSISDYKAGKTKALAFLVGQVMKLTRGKASPEIVNQLIAKKLDAK